MFISGPVSVAEWDGKPQADPGVLDRRKSETDEFYEQLIGGLNEEAKNVAKTGICRAALEQTTVPLYCAGLARPGTKTSRSRPTADGRDGTMIGCTCTAAMSFQCRTNGNIPGLPPGISLFTCCLSLISIQLSRSSN